MVAVFVNDENTLNMAGRRFQLCHMDTVALGVVAPDMEDVASEAVLH